MGTFVSSRQVQQFINLMTPWWLSGASIDLDFDQQRYYDSSLGGSASLAPLNSYLSISRASTGYAQNLAGSWIAFGNDTLRITDRGLLCEDARTNYLINSGAPATQTTTSLGTGTYTLWVEGSGSALASAGSATITGASSATEGAPDQFTVTVAGTVTVTVSGSLTRFQLEAGNFASSWISTAGAAATRAADVTTCLGNLNSLLIALPFSAVLDCKVNNLGGNAHMLSDNSGVHNHLRVPGDNLTVTSSISGVALNKDFTSSGVSWTGGAKGGVALASGARSLTAGGLTVATDTTAAALNTGVTALGGNNSDQLFGYIRRATFWNSKLADATLQSLTAP